MPKLWVLLGALLVGGSASAQSEDVAVPEAPKKPVVVDPTLTGMVVKVGPASVPIRVTSRGWGSTRWWWALVGWRRCLKRTHYLSGNLIFTPVRSFDVGAELLFGRREERDGAGDNAVRLLFSTRFFY